MKVKVIKRDFGFSNYGNYYFRNEEGTIYYWYTSSEKAYEELEEGNELEIKFKDCDDVWMNDGKEIHTIKNVRW